MINTEAIVDDVVVSVVTNLLLNTKKKKSSSSSSSNISNVSSDVQREIFDAAEDARGQRPLEASMELCDTLKLERRVGVDENASGDVQRNAAMEEDMDAIEHTRARCDLLRFLKEKKCDGAGDVHEQRRTDEENEE